MNRVKALDGLRGVSCLIILFGHIDRNGNTILPAYIVAMDIFFALSGFLITGIILCEYEKSNTINLFEFWKRRSIRLLPLFYIYFIFSYSLYIITNYRPLLGSNPFITLFSTFFYFSNWTQALGYNLGFFSITWSLGVEEQFYLLTPLFFLLMLRYTTKKNIILILLLLIFATCFHRYTLFHELMSSKGMMTAWKRCYFSLDTRVDSLLVGCLGKLFYEQYGKRVQIGLKTAIVSMFSLFGVFFIRDIPLARHEVVNTFHTDGLMAGGFTFFSFLSVLLIIHFLQFPNSFVSKLFSSHIFVRIGIMSYSIYLWHITAFESLDFFTHNLGNNLNFWICQTISKLVFALLVGYLSFRFIEYPILFYQRKRRKFSAIILAFR
jgi:peptidoglycan/LPS O-acetylase OafA/YrhL